MENIKKFNGSIIIKSFLLFYLINLNSPNNLLSKQMNNFIQDNRMIDHIIKFITLYVLMILLDVTNNHIYALMYSITIYFWFIFSTKLDIHLNLIVLAILFFSFLNNNRLNEYINDIMEDKILTDENKKIIINNQKNYSMEILIIILLITCTGNILYSNRKELQYGGGFDPIKYIFY
jgi:hypothetical protein